MSKTKPFVKTCVKCNKPFSTADDSITLCRACMDKKLLEEAKAEKARLEQVATTKKCPGCGKEFSVTVGEREFMTEKGMKEPRFCKECRAILKKRRKEKQEEKACAKCGKPFTLSSMDILRNELKEHKMPTMCAECRREAEAAANKRAESRKTYKTATCRECGKEFRITVGEHEFLTAHGLEYDPARCPDCRHKRKVAAVVKDMQAEESAVVEDSASAAEKETTAGPHE